MKLSLIETPCYVVDLGRLKRNLKILNGVSDRTGCKILLALKSFSMHACAPLIRRHLAGTAASSVDEARLGREEFGGEVHVLAPAYSKKDFKEILALADHVVFNSMSQWRCFGPAAKKKGIECGLRINPGYSEVGTEIYNPCGPESRFGLRASELKGEDLSGIDGLHFHALCEQGADVLERVLVRVERNFKKYFARLKWLNFGGGHHVTKKGYDLGLLHSCIMRVKNRYGLEVYLEPGEAIALNAGVLVASVLDITGKDKNIAILDASAACHMPDVIEMPYRPRLVGAGKPGELPHTYILGGNTCLAGDVIGKYSFARRLKPGQKLVFEDMAIYTMVKNNTFNGVRLPSIAVWEPKSGKLRTLRRFGYRDFKTRLS